MLDFQPLQNVINSDASLIVNTVNTVGVMGKGVALDMRNAFPAIMEPYQEACRSGRLAPGTFQLVPLEDGRAVLNLATKEHWRDPSRYEWVGAGLVYLNRYLVERPGRFGSVCMPMPGCGNGGLEASRVLQMIRTYLRPALEAGLDLRICGSDHRPIADPVYYAGVGARDTPGSAKNPGRVLDLMSEIGFLMAEAGFRLRSGGARGADTAFWEGARLSDAPMEIFTPRKRDDIPGAILHLSEVHKRMARNFHPTPEALSPNPDNRDDRRHVTLALMARNGNQVFGTDFTNPSNLVICWTEGGKGGGGTGQAIRLATSAGIPVIDLGKPELSGIGASEVVDLAIERITRFRQARGLPEITPRRECAPEPC
ncbi:macro domain-containing protein [Defluviimonas salinarum]|uniref:Macro domain-containing protein n=1 Tax=Defluviimonas salinarum TaxID=2992147 RepID=A0ABT3J940_9RHOB|nr:macro domain-containing protein [Defluviimonas salinarum]MCW3783909.1 hypothetical protein [Defluviimonas salinarum]